MLRLTLKKSWKTWFAVVLASGLGAAALAADTAVAPKAKAKAKPAVAAAPKTPESTTKPVPRDSKWMKRHDSINARVKQGKVDLIFIGDSITHGWEGKGKDVWTEYYGKRNAANLGIGGDRTQHVIWRLQNGNIDGISPKLAVIMIGTNNARDNSPQDIAAGVKAIVDELRAKLPQMKILLLAIFPRGSDDQNPQHQTNVTANALIAKMADGKTIEFLDFGAKLLNPDRSRSKDIMPDLLHLSPAGYKIWAEAVEPIVAREVGPK